MVGRKKLLLLLMALLLLVTPLSGCYDTLNDIASSIDDIGNCTDSIQTVEADVGSYTADDCGAVITIAGGNHTDTVIQDGTLYINADQGNVTQVWYTIDTDLGTDPEPSVSDTLRLTSSDIDITGNSITDTVNYAYGTDSIDDTHINWGSGAGQVNLLDFDDQTTWRVFYSDGSGDVTELALGSAGEYLKSQGASAAPTWGTPTAAAGGCNDTISVVGADTGSNYSASGCSGVLMIVGANDISTSSDGAGNITVSADSALTRDEEWNTIGEIEGATSVNIIVSTEIDEESELEALLTDVSNLITATEINSESKLEGLLADVANVIISTEIDSESELEGLLADVANVIVSTEIDEELELEALLSDVSNVFTNNDGALSDDDLSDDDLDALQNVAALTESLGDILYYSGNWTTLSADIDGKVLKLSGGVPVWGDDDTGAATDYWWTVDPQQGDNLTPNGNSTLSLWEGEGITIVGYGGNNTIRIASEVASYSNLGVCLFYEGDYTVSAGNVTLADDYIRIINTDSGSATGSSHDVDIVGGTNISTSAVGDVITINYTGGAPLSDYWWKWDTPSGTDLEPSGNSTVYFWGDPFLDIIGYANSTIQFDFDMSVATDLDANGALVTGSVGDNEIDYSEVTLDDFDYQTAWRLFYSNTDGDVTELALGADGTYLKSNGAGATPTWSTPTTSDYWWTIYVPDGDSLVPSGNSTLSLWSPDMTLTGTLGNTTIQLVINDGALNDEYIELGDAFGGEVSGTYDNLTVNSGIHDDEYIELGDSFVGDVTGTYDATVVGNDSHSHTGSTISGLDISDDTNLTAGDHITLTDDDLDIDDDFLLNNGDAGTGTYDFGGATSFEIPNSADPDVTHEGDISYDSDDDALRGYDGSNQVVLGMKAFTVSFTVTSPGNLTTGTSRGDASCVVWHNFTGFTFNITSIKAWSDDQNYDFDLFESNSATDIDTGTDSLIDLLECDSAGTDVYTDTETVFSDSAVATDHCIIFAHNAGSTDWVHVEIYGWLDANVA